MKIIELSEHDQYFMYGDGKPDFLPTGFAPLDLIVQLILTPVLQQMKEMEEDIINDILEQSKDNGVVGIKNFIGTRANVTNYNNPYTNEDDEKIYDLIEITQETYNKLMMGEFKTLRSLKDYDKQLEEENKKLFYQGKIQKLENNKNYTILYKWQDDKSINDQIIVIETIFTKC